MDKKIRFIVEASMIAALYVAITLIFQAFSFGAVQVRISEALTILPLFTPAAIPGLFVGCLIANIIGGGVVWDVIFGSIATLIGALITYLLRNKKPVYGPIGPIVANTLIVPIVITYCYGSEYALPLVFLFIFIGEVISCGILGLILYKALFKVKFIFYKYN